MSRIPLFKPFVATEEVLAALRTTLNSGMITQGPMVDAFEAELAKVVGAPVLTVNSGTTALELASYLALSAPTAFGPLGKRSVLTTPVTCIATQVPFHNDADLYWADVDPTTGNIDPESVRKLLGEPGRYIQAVMAVDWGGLPCDYDELKAAAHAAGAVVIQDAAHSFGAYYKGRAVGNGTADFTCFSFQAIKTLTCVDGGGITFSGKDHATAGVLRDRARLLRWFGVDRTRSYDKDERLSLDVPEFGWKYHMNDVAATIGLVNLKHFSLNLTRQWSNANYYRRELAGVEGVTLLRKLGDRQSTDWLFTILLDGPDRRESFRDYMTKNDVQVSEVHRRNDSHSCFKGRAWAIGGLPGVDEFCRRQIAIPVGWWLSEDDRKRIVNCVKEWSAGAYSVGVGL